MFIRYGLVLHQTNHCKVAYDEKACHFKTLKRTLLYIICLLKLLAIKITFCVQAEIHIFKNIK